MFEAQPSFCRSSKQLWNGGNPPTAGKEVGHLFLHTLLWCTKEYGDKRGRNPATLKLLTRDLGLSQMFTYYENTVVRVAKTWDSPHAGTVPVLLGEYLNHNGRPEEAARCG